MPNEKRRHRRLYKCTAILQRSLEASKKVCFTAIDGTTRKSAIDLSFVWNMTCGNRRCNLNTAGTHKRKGLAMILVRTCLRGDEYHTSTGSTVLRRVLVCKKFELTNGSQRDILLRSIGKDEIKVA